MAVVEVVLGAMIALAGGGAGWLGRGKYDERLRARSNAETKRAKSAKRIAGGLKAAETRAKKKQDAQAKVVGQGEVNLGLVQKQQFQGRNPVTGAFENGAAQSEARVAGDMYGRGEL